MSDTKVVEFKIEGDTQKTTCGVGIYRMEFDFNELVRAETLTGLNLMAFHGGGMSANQTRAHVFAALAKHHPGATLEDSGELLTKAREDVMAALGELYGQPVPEDSAISE